MKQAAQRVNGSLPEAGLAGVGAVEVGFKGDGTVSKSANGKYTLDYSGLADALLPAVLAAGRIEMAAWDDEGLQVRHKVDDSPVTDADHDAEDVLIVALSQAAPGVLVIGEERAGETRAPVGDEPFFLVDPLDGTRNFIEHLPEFTVNVALIVDGRPVFGMIYAPALQALYVTTSLNSAVEAKVACGETPHGLAGCRTTPIRARRSDPEELVALASRSHCGDEIDGLLAKLGKCRTRCMGSSIKFCLIARGEGDVYLRTGETSEWDTAAGEAILRAAGGAVTSFDGKSLVYGQAGDGYRNPPFVAWGDKALMKQL